MPGDAYEKLTASSAARPDTRASTSHHKGDQIPGAIGEEQEQGGEG